LDRHSGAARFDFGGRHNAGELESHTFEPRARKICHNRSLAPSNPCSGKRSLWACMGSIAQSRGWRHTGN